MKELADDLNADASSSPGSVAKTSPASPTVTISPPRNTLEPMIDDPNTVRHWPVIGSRSISENNTLSA